ncbi:rifampicin phosphotransferase isoform X5 [Parasteatoda tepidariorum]|uniref:rifampicin phosphotransferase isoform X2 n=1 Tax=Parasteatoda tepidariorum TaxID=114398 RepID=UPI0039BD4077
MDIIWILLVIIVTALVFLKNTDYVYWQKWIISYICVKLYKIKSKKRFDLYDYSKTNDPVRANFIVPQEEYDIEAPQPASVLINSHDEVFFYGENSNSDVLIVRINRLSSTTAEASIYLKLSKNKSYHLEKNCDFQQSCTDGMVFSCGSLQLHCQLPMRRWRLFFAGYLREVSENDQSSKKSVYVKFALLWRASSDVYDFASDVSTKCLTNGLVNASWEGFCPQIKSLQQTLDFYGQSGVIHGTITVENEFEDKEIYLFGHRIRYLGKLFSQEEFDFYHILGYTKKSGTFLHLGNITSSTAKDFSFGFVVQSDADLKSIQKAAVAISQSESYNIGSVQANYHTDTFSYDLKGLISSSVLSSEKSSQSIYLKRLEIDLNGEKGYGILLKRQNPKEAESMFMKEKVRRKPSVIPAVLPFKEDLCQAIDITGGKGSSLGKLMELSESLNKFIVPDGVVITTSAYSNFLTKNIEAKIKDLEEVSYKNHADREQVAEACKSLMEVIIGTEFSAELQDSIKEKLLKHFGQNLHSRKYAVRSSATGEDTDQMSAAGQMETFLGVAGIDEILLAIKKCWASQFSFIATEYKRRYGQSYNSPMAVVVQEMIPCDVAGVLFTCDPLTGNPTLMSITANYGLGESVVSGSEEPDMIYLKRDENDTLHVKSIDIGKKNRKIIVDDHGTSAENVSENEQNICSLSEEMIMRLGYVAIKIEKHYHSHRDLEWGFFKNNLYIFQSRPVTCSTKETTYEIDHEFDGPLRVENDFHSVSNAGEVMPKGLSPLSLDHTLKNVQLLTNSAEKKTIFQLKGKAIYFRKGFVLMYNHFMMNVADVFPLKEKEEISGLKKATLIALFGRVPDVEEMYQVCRDRYGLIPEANPLLTMKMLITTMLQTGNIVRDCSKTISKYSLSVEKYNTSNELFDAILYACTDLAPVTLCHTISSQTSSLLNLIVLMILGAGQGDVGERVYNDFGKLLKTGIDVESADVPSATQSIAFHIGKEMKPEDFKKMSVQEALNWLQTSSTVAGEKFRQFIEKHGHRCLQEFDLHSVRWRENPEILIKLLQSLVGNVSNVTTENNSDNVDDLLSGLSVQLGTFAKFFLKWILPFTRRGVQYRETSKSLFIKGYDEWRKGWKRMGQLMVEEGRIPDEDLLFFMTVDEIQHLLKTRSPNVIARASQRRKRFAITSEYRFPEIMKGIPKPMEYSTEDIVINEINFSMKGIPVSQGVVKGFVRKAMTLDEAAHIKPGEILLTYSTDICWSPYFPYLAGVVTELGGLISHGAVVSREYGIPCIAGLHGATKHFQTGDYVILDGNKGILQKVQPPEN